MTRTSRKKDHIQFALQTGQSGSNGLDDVRFVPNCIPQSNLDEISLATVFGGLALSSPIVINAMTGGAEETYEINRRLAGLANEKNLAMAVGSQMAGIKDPSVANSYSVVRKMHPNGVIFANLGCEATVEQAKRAVEMIEADALQLHLNVMQELIMPEGDRDFQGVLERISAIVEALPCPVMVKEVGFGLSFESAQELSKTGIHALDIGGSGGTNFAVIENKRRELPLDMLNDWGMTTAESLLEMSRLSSTIDIMATGGITNGLQVVKSMALGATAVGMAGFFLRLVTSYKEAEAHDGVNYLFNQIRTVMTALGVKSTGDLLHCPIVISGATHHWADQRGIDCKKYSQRTK